MKSDGRGMVRYAPYQSLVEQSKYLAAMRKQKAQVEKKTLLDDEAQEIDGILSQYGGEEVVLSYWKSGEIREVEGTIRRIDLYERCLWMGDTRIPLSNLQSLKRK